MCRTSSLLKLFSLFSKLSNISSRFPGIILCMGSANERRRYNETSSLIGWAHTQNDPWFPVKCQQQTLNYWKIFLYQWIKVSTKHFEINFLDWKSLFWFKISLTFEIKNGWLSECCLLSPVVSRPFMGNTNQIFNTVSYSVFSNFMGI